MEKDNSLKNKVETIKAIYYNGREDNTLTKVDNESHFKCITIRESHEVIVAEPGSRNIDHVSPKSGKSKR